MVLENCIDVEIAELVRVAFFGHVCDVAHVPAILSRVFPCRADLQTEILALRHQSVLLQRQTPKPKLKPDVIRWLIGTEPCRVFALGTRGFEADVETNYAAILQYTSGTRAMLDGGFDCPRRNRCEIVGESGTITITSPFISVEGATVQLQTPTSNEARTFPLVDPFQIQFEHFSGVVLSSGAPAISPNETMSNARVLAALRASVNSGSPVNIPTSATDRCGDVPGDQGRDKRNE